MKINTFLRENTGIIVLSILISILLFWGIGTPELHGAEGRWAAISQNMFRTGEVFAPHIGKLPYYDKPFFSYWLVLPFAWAMGNVNEAAIRLPSALAVIAAMLLTYAFACRFFTRRTGILAAFAFCTTFSILYWGKNGQVEMLNLVGILGILWIFFRYRSAERFGWFYAIAVLMAIVSNMKGLLGYTVPGFVIFMHSLIQRDWKWLKLKHVLAAGILSAGVYALPFLLAYLVTGKWDAIYMVYKENIVRFFSPFDHKKPFYYYSYGILFLSLPWSVFLPWGVVHFFKDKDYRRPEYKTLLIIIAAIFLFFTLSGSRRSYYLLPVLPFISIFIATFFEKLPELSLGWKKSVTVLWIFVGTALCFPVLVLLTCKKTIATMVAKVVLKEKTVSQIMTLLFCRSMWITVIIALILGAVLIAKARKVDFRTVLYFHLLIYLAMLVYYALLSPEFEKFREVRPFTAKAAKFVGSEKLFVVRPSSKEVFYLNKNRVAFEDIYDMQKIESVISNVPETKTFLIYEGIPRRYWHEIAREEKIQLKEKEKKRTWKLYQSILPENASYK